MKTCSVINCGRRFYARGYCNMHYIRWRKFSDVDHRGNPRGDAQKYFYEVVLAYDGDDCLIWPFHRDHGGYGKLWIDRRQQQAPRRACEEVKGPPPTPKHEAAHSCGKGHEGCVNPRHLSWKTPTDNAADRIIHGTVARGERHGKAKITEDQARSIISLHGSLDPRTIAQHFGISRNAVYSIISGRNWTHIERPKP